MSSSSSFPVSQDTLTQYSGSGSPSHTSLSMSQVGYLSAVVTNPSMPALSPRAIIPSRYSQVVNAERSANSFGDLPNLSFTTPNQEHEVVYPHFPMHSNNNDNMVPVPLAASQANAPIPQTSGSLMPYQSQNSGMAGNNQAAPFNFSNRVVSHAPGMVSSPSLGGSRNNVGFQAPRASMANVPIAAQRLYRARLMAARQEFTANNSIPPQHPGYAQDMMPSGYSHVSNAEGNGPTNPAMAYNPFACQSREMATAPVLNNAIPSQAPVSGVNPAKSPSPTAPNSSDLVTVTGSNNVNSLVPYASDASTSSIQTVHGHSRILSRNELLPFVCSDCLDRFSCPQALGGHRSWHSKQRRKKEESKSDRTDIRGNKKFKSKSS